MASDKFYVVFVGQVPGIYRTWEECQMQVHNYSENLDRSFKNYAEAEKAYVMHHGRWNRVLETSMSITATTSTQEEPVQSSSTNQLVQPNTMSNVVWMNGFFIWPSTWFNCDDCDCSYFILD